MTQFKVRYPKWRIILSAVLMALCAAICAASVCAYFFVVEDPLFLMLTALAAAGGKFALDDWKEKRRLELTVDESGLHDGSQTVKFCEILSMEMDAGRTVKLKTEVGEYAIPAGCVNAEVLRAVLLEKLPWLVQPTVRFRKGLINALWILMVLGNVALYMLLEDLVPWLAMMALMGFGILVPSVEIALLEDAYVRFSRYFVEWEWILPKPEMFWRSMRRASCNREHGLRWLRLRSGKKNWKILLTGRVYIDEKWQRHFGRDMEQPMLELIARYAEKNGRKVEKKGSKLKMKKEKATDEDSRDWLAPQHSTV